MLDLCYLMLTQAEMLLSCKLWCFSIYSAGHALSHTMKESVVVRYRLTKRKQPLQ